MAPIDALTLLQANAAAWEGKPEGVHSIRSSLLEIGQVNPQDLADLTLLAAVAADNALSELHANHSITELIAGDAQSFTQTEIKQLRSLQRKKDQALDEVAFILGLMKT